MYKILGWITSKWEVILSLPKRWQEYREAKHRADKAKVEARTAEEQLKQAKTQTVIGERTLADMEQSQRIDNILERIYSEQARVEAELRAEGKSFASLQIPSEHWNKVFLAEKPEEVVEAFRLKNERETNMRSNPRWKSR